MIVLARNLRIGDVAEHPDTHQLAQVAALRVQPADVHVLTLSLCHWHLEPGRAVAVLHRIVEDG